MLTNEQIRDKVYAILNAVPKDPKLKPEDEVAILAGVDLVINLFQNINDIANKS